MDGVLATALVWGGSEVRKNDNKVDNNRDGKAPAEACAAYHAGRGLTIGDIFTSMLGFIWWFSKQTNKNMGRARGPVGRVNGPKTLRHHWEF